MQPLLLLPRRILSGVVRAYQIFVSPLLPPSCRFTPSCSQYALEALTRHGALKGSWLATRRLARCHPWNRGGYDPVPKLKVSGMRGRHCEEAAPPPPKQSP